MKNPERRAYLELHLAVLLFGFTAILGDLIQLSALVLVWWRVLLTCASLLILVRMRKVFSQLSRLDLLKFAGIGVLVALHWIAFYGSIKLANASIGVVCIATTSFFTAVMEPFFMGYRVRWYELGLGILIIPGMWLIVDSTDVTMVSGIWVGLLSAFLASLFAIFNKILVNKMDTLSITFVELGSAWIFLSLLLPFFFFGEGIHQFMPSASDWIYLILLALLCTTLAFVLALRALRYISAFASNLTINLEPVYGIALACLILKENEELSVNFYWGVGIILLTVFSYPLLRRKFGSRHEPSRSVLD